MAVLSCALTVGMVPARGWLEPQGAQDQDGQGADSGGERDQGGIREPRGRGRRNVHLVPNEFQRPFNLRH